jgi:hypothetical protein
LDETVGVLLRTESLPVQQHGGMRTERYGTRDDPEIAIRHTEVDRSSEAHSSATQFRRTADKYLQQFFVITDLERPLALLQRLPLFRPAEVCRDLR